MHCMLVVTNSNRTWSGEEGGILTRGNVLRPTITAMNYFLDMDGWT